MIKEVFYRFSLEGLIIMSKRKKTIIQGTTSVEEASRDKDIWITQESRHIFLTLILDFETLLKTFGARLEKLVTEFHHDG